MASSRRSRRYHSLVALMSVIAALGAAAASSLAASASAATTSSALKQATGYNASQLPASPVCGAVEAGEIRCLAQVLTVKRGGRTAPLLHAPHARSVSRAAAASAAPGQYTAPYLQWAYDTTWLSANNGAADTVAIVDAYGDSNAYSDMEQFRSANGLPAQPLCGGSVTTSCFEVVNQNGHSSPLPTDARDETGSWNIEESLDIDAVSTICPLCKILVVEANSDDYYGSADLETGVSTAARLGANQISLSWGTDVSPDEAGHSTPYSSITTASILAASGDESYQGPSVGYPAALPNVTAVGGTALSSNSSAARGFTETAWAKYACSGPGGFCGTESGCDTSQPTRPSYQSGVATGCAGRAYNDISADGDPNTGLDIYDSQPGGEGCGTANNWCIVGGTSLATPLTAAFEAIAGITDKTPAWTYNDALLLNDVKSGSDGTCPSGQTVICVAGVGWDGPTGNGSIDGDIVSGAPGIGLQPNASGVGSTSANVSAEVNPNDPAPATTTYYWQYGLTTSYGSTTAPTSLSSGTPFASATALLPSLSQPCTYHYRIVAANALGTVYGYDHTVTTTQTTTAPVNTAPPAITGTAAIGVQLSASPGTWSNANCQDTTYQWQESSSQGGPWTAIRGATSATYTPTTSDGGEYLEVVVTNGNNGGSTSAASQPTAQVPAPPVAATQTTTTTTAATPTTTTPAPAPSTTETVRFYRCARSCVLINTHGATTYQPQKADYGRYIKVVSTTTLTTNNIRTASVTTRWVGPISSSTAGAVSFNGSARVASVTAVRASSHKLLARVRIAKRTRNALRLVVTRQGRTPTQVWAYVVRKGAVVSCTAAHALHGSVTLSVGLKAGQTLKLVAVQT